MALSREEETRDNTDYLGAGVSAASLAADWDRLNTRQKADLIARIAKQTGQTNATMDTALSIASLGAGWKDLSPAQRTIKSAQILEQIGSLTGISKVPVVGSASALYNVAKGWGEMSNEQRAVGTTALAAAGAQTAAALGAELPGYVIPGLNIALAAYTAGQFAKSGYEEYSKNGTAGQKRAYDIATMGTGRLGVNVGSVRISPTTGIDAMLGAISMFSSLGRSGKGKSQVARDSVRADLQKKGLVDDDFNIILADGSKANIGVDGNGGIHEVRNKNQLTVDKNGKVGDGKAAAYNTDYTNDLDYASGMAGVTLQRLLYGGRQETIDQMGAQLGNAFLSSVGYGQDMTEENFGKVMSNAKALYARAGIKSKEDGLRLLKMAAEQKRLSAADQAAAMQTFDMLYDQDAYKKGSALMSGRQVGMAKAGELPERTPTIKGPISAAPENLAVDKAEELTEPSDNSKEESAEEAAIRTAKEGGMEVDKVVNLPNIVNPIGRLGGDTNFSKYFEGNNNYQPAPNLGASFTKEDARFKNINRYNQMAV